jgi:hypothetical protein
VADDCNAPTASVEEARSDGGVFNVTGHIVASAHAARLCDALSASEPPSCQGASVAIPGFDYERFTRRADVERAGSTAWTPGKTRMLGSVTGERFRGAGCA